MKRSFPFIAGGLLVLIAGSLALQTSFSRAQSRDGESLSAT